MKNKNAYARFFLLIAIIAANSANAGAALEEITVTAQLREQSLQTVPIAMSAFTAQTLQEQGIDNIRDIARQDPALEVQANTGPIQVGYRIRRVGNLSNIPTFESSVGVYLDGAFRSRPFFGAGDLFDLERVEVLRGPQITLYGKNASAGVIGTYTQKPSVDTHASAEFTVGELEGAQTTPLYRFKGGVSGTIVDDLRGSFGVAYAAHGHSDESALIGADNGENSGLNSQQRVALRGQLYWQDDATDVRFIAAHLDQNEDSHDGDLYYDPKGFVATIILPTLQAAGISTPCTSNNPRDRKSCVRNAIHSELTSWEGTLLANHRLANDWTINSITSFDRYYYANDWDDIAQLAAPILKSHDTQAGDSAQQQLRLLSPGNATIDWLLGAMYYHNHFRYGDGSRRPEFYSDTQSANPTLTALNGVLFGAAIPLATPGQQGQFLSTQDTDYRSVFAQGTWNASARWLLSAGLRWQHETKRMVLDNSLNDPTPSLISLVFTPPSVNGSAQRSSNGSAWSLTPQFRWNDTTLLYVTAAQGFQSGGFNTGFGGAPLNQREYKDQDVTHVEAGIKASLWAERLRWRFDVFHTEYKNYQDAAFISSQFQVSNAERANLDGFELEGEAALTENFTLNAAISYTDFIYGKNTHGQCDPFRQPDSATQAGACDLSGQHPINSPPWKTQFGAQWLQPIGAQQFYEQLAWEWTDSYNTTTSLDPHQVQRAYNWVNLRAGVRWSHYDIAAWVDNALNETVVDVAAVQNIYAGPGDGSVQTYLQDGRSFGITLRASY